MRIQYTLFTQNLKHALKTAKKVEKNAVSRPVAELTKEAQDAVSRMPSRMIQLGEKPKWIYPR